MKEKAKEWGFFVAAFLLFSWLLSFLAPTPENASPAPQINLPAFTSTDWIMILVGVGSIPAALLMVFILEMRSRRSGQLQTEAGPVQVVEAEELQAPATERPIIFNGASPEVVNRIAQQRDDWKRKYEELLPKYQALLQTPQSAPEPAQMLTYASVIALLQECPSSINKAQEIVRREGGTVPRDYSPLAQIVKLLALSPTTSSSPIHNEKQAVNSPANGKCPAANGATGRSQPRRRGRG